jgi:hypothetical protein
MQPPTPPVDGANTRNGRGAPPGQPVDRRKSACSPSCGGLSEDGSAVARNAEADGPPLHGRRSREPPSRYQGGREHCAGWAGNRVAISSTGRRTRMPCRDREGDRADPVAVSDRVEPGHGQDLPQPHRDLARRLGPEDRLDVDAGVQRAEQSGLVPSMGSIGDCYDCRRRLVLASGTDRTAQPSPVANPDRSGQRPVRVPRDVPQPRRRTPPVARPRHDPDRASAPPSRWSGGGPRSGTRRTLDTGGREMRGPCGTPARAAVLGPRACRTSLQSTQTPWDTRRPDQNCPLFARWLPWRPLCGAGTMIPCHDGHEA